MRFEELLSLEGAAKNEAQRHYEQQFVGVYIAGACQVQVLAPMEAPCVVIASPLEPTPEGTFLENPRGIAEAVLEQILHHSPDAFYFVECYPEWGDDREGKQPRFFAVSFAINPEGERHAMSRAAVAVLLGERPLADQIEIPADQYDQTQRLQF